MTPDERAVLEKHFKQYVGHYTEQGVTFYDAVVNYTRQFPSRVPLLIVALAQHGQAADHSAN
jgi:hypothetical protein